MCEQVLDTINPCVNSYIKLEGRSIMPIEVKNLSSQADEVKEMPNARVESVNVLGGACNETDLSARMEMVARYPTYSRNAKLSGDTHRHHHGRLHPLRLR